MQLGCDQSIISHAAPQRLSPADTSHLPLHLALVCYIVGGIRKLVGTRIDLWQCFKGQTHPRGATASLRQETDGNWNTGKWLIFLSFTVLLKKKNPKQSASPTRTVDGDPPLPPHNVQDLTKDLSIFSSVLCKFESEQQGTAWSHGSNLLITSYTCTTCVPCFSALPIILIGTHQKSV